MEKVATALVNKAVRLGQRDHLSEARAAAQEAISRLEGRPEPALVAQLDEAQKLLALIADLERQPT